jgi:hypothetical protein
MPVCRRASSKNGREQGFLLAPDVREWLAADRLAWFVIEAVAVVDLSGFMPPIGPMVMAGLPMGRR